MTSTLPDHLTPTLRAALSDAAAALHDLYGDRLRHLVLFGSQARGDARNESDVDVLVVLHDTFDAAHEIRRLVDIELDVFDRYGVNVHLLPFEAHRYADAGHPLMMNVHREGIRL